MRPFVPALLGGLAGAASALMVVWWRAPSEVRSPAADPDLATAVARIEDRLNRLERAAPPRGRGAPEPATAPLAAAPADDVEEHNGPFRGREDAPVATAADDGSLEKVPSETLALEGDERHKRDYDIAGAARRFRELLSRGGTPAERRHWQIRLGDCYVRLGRTAEAMDAYRACVDASAEDHEERVACMVALARHERSGNAFEAQRWIDRALATEVGRADPAVHEVAAALARDGGQLDVEARELTWLAEHAPLHPSATGWKERLAEIRGERR